MDDAEKELELPRDGDEFIGCGRRDDEEERSCCCWDDADDEKDDDCWEMTMEEYPKSPLSDVVVRLPPDPLRNRVEPIKSEQLSLAS